MRNAVSANDFVPYELDDLGVIIPHSNLNPNRWAWFWPQFRAATPDAVLRNTIVVYHQRDGKPASIPDNVQAIEIAGSTLLVLEREGQSIVWPFKLGLESIKTRIVTRIANDVEICDPGWAQKVIEIYNEPPHLKILAMLTAPGLAYDKIKHFCNTPWVERLLHHGDYDAMDYYHGSIIIANRAIWRAYYPEVAALTRHDTEDILFTLFSRADGVPVVPWGAQLFRHRGPTGQDVILP